MVSLTVPNAGARAVAADQGSVEKTGRWALDSESSALATRLIAQHPRIPDAYRLEVTLKKRRQLVHREIRAFAIV